MNLFDVMTNFVPLATELEQPELFPFPFGMHLVFSCVSLIFFLYRFSAAKQPYQLILAIAIPFSLVIWLSDSRGLFYFVGAVELLLIIAAFVSTLIFRNKTADEAPAAAADAEKTEEPADAPSENAEEASAVNEETSADKEDEE